ARRERHIGSSIITAISGLQSKRIGRIEVPMPRLTYIREPFCSYQPATYLPQLGGNQNGFRSGRRTCPPWVWPLRATSQLPATRSKKAGEWNRAILNAS